MKAYIYNTDTNVVIATIEGASNDQIEEKAEELNFFDVDEYGMSYSNTGLEDTTETENYKA